MVFERCIRPVVAICVGSMAAWSFADIYQWEYVDANDPSQGKRASALVTPGGAGVTAGPMSRLAGLDLTMAYLATSDLSGARFERSNLSNAELSYSNLSDVSFSSAILTGAAFTGCILTHTSFAFATGFTREQLYSAGSYQARNLSRINLQGLRMSGIELSGQNLTGAYLAGMDMSQAQLIRATLVGAELRTSNLAAADFRGANLRSASLSDAVLTGAIFWRRSLGANMDINSIGTGISPAQLYSTANYQAGNLEFMRFVRNNLAGADLSGQRLSRTNFYAANLRDANFAGADLQDAGLAEALVAGANFEDAIITDAGLAGVRGFTLPQLYSTSSYKNRRLSGTSFSGLNLTGANLREQDLSHASLQRSTLSGADLTNASIAGADLGSVKGLTASQIYETADYRAKALNRIDFSGADFSGGNFSVQNLSGTQFNSAKLQGANFAASRMPDTNLSYADATGASFRDSVLSGASLFRTLLANADFSGADVRDAAISTYGGPGISAAQLYSTKSYLEHDLTSIGLDGMDFHGGKFSAQNLSGASLFNDDFRGADFRASRLTDAAIYNCDLTDADFSEADARGAMYFNPIGAKIENLIHPDGRIQGLTLTPGLTLVVRDYRGISYGNVIPIQVQQSLVVTEGGRLKIEFDDGQWDSTISIAHDIPVVLGGILELTFSQDVNVREQVGRSINLFNWLGVTPDGLFQVVSAYEWDLSALYSSGSVKLLAVPEPMLTPGILVIVGLWPLFVRRWSSLRDGPQN